MVAGASSVFRAGVAWVVVLMAVRAAAAPNRPDCSKTCKKTCTPPYRARQPTQARNVLFPATFSRGRPGTFFISSFYPVTQF